MSDEVVLKLEDVAGSSDPDYKSSENFEEGEEAEKQSKVSYIDRFKSILLRYCDYGDKKSWWDAVEACIKRDDDFRERVSRKAGQADGEGEGEKPKRQAIIEVMVDLLLEIEEMSLSKALMYTLDESQPYLMKYPCDFMAKELLKRGADPNEETNSVGQTPLHLAANKGAEEMMKLLLKKGALVNKQDNRGNTPLLLAVEGVHCRMSMIKLLIENGANTQIVNARKETALHMAATKGTSQRVELFCELGFSVEAENEWGLRPLHIAANLGSTECVEALLLKGANVNAVDFHKRTPLHIAVEDGSQAVVKCLLSKNADAGMSDLEGYTALDLAALKGSTMYELLLECGMLSSRDRANAWKIDDLLDTESGRRVKDDVVTSKLREISSFAFIKMMENDSVKCADNTRDQRYFMRVVKDKNLKESAKIMMDHCVQGKGETVICEFLEADSKGVSPKERGFDPNSPSVLDAIVETNNKELARHPAVKTIVDHKWNKFVRWKFLASFGVYLLRTLLFALALLIAARPDLDNPGCYRSGWDIVRGILEGLTLILFVLKGLDEVLELIQNKEEYIKDYYNWLQVLAIAMPFTIIPFRAATTWCASTGVGYCALPNGNSTDINSTDINVSCIVASHVQWIFAAMAYLVNAILIMEYLAIFKLTGVYVRILIKIVKSDILKFSILYMVFLFFFVGSFYFALRAGVTITGDGQIISDANRFQLETLYPWNVLFTGVRILVESQGIIEGYFANDDSGDVYVGYQWFSVALYMLFLFVVIVVLLNLLIAQMSDSYTKVQEDVEGTFAIARLRTVARLQKAPFFLFFGPNNRKKFYQKYLRIDVPEVTKPSVEEENASAISSLRDMMARKTEELTRRTEALTRLTEELAEELLKEKRTKEEEARKLAARDGSADFSFDWSRGDFDDHIDPWPFWQ